MRRLVLLYPREWRRRYEAEFVALLEDCGLTPRFVADVVLGALRARLESRPGAGPRRLTRQAMTITAGAVVAFGTVLVGLLEPMLAYSYGFIGLIGAGFLIGRLWSALVWLGIIWLAAPLAALGVIPGPFDLGMWLLFSGLAITLSWLGVVVRLVFGWAVRHLSIAQPVRR
jgi:hypothetical protein